MQNFFTEEERECFSRNTFQLSSKSITDRVFWSGVFRALAQYVPQDISPNILSISSALCLLQGWYMCESYGERFPVFSTLSLVLAILAWFALDQIDEYHAYNIGNNYNFVHLFDHVCSNVGIIFLAISLARALFGFDCDAQAIWYVAQIIQFVVLNKHVKALRVGKIEYKQTLGPGEAVVFVVVLLLSKCYNPQALLDWQQRETTLGMPQYLTLLCLMDFAQHLYFLKLTLDLPEAHARTAFLLRLCVLVLHLPTAVGMVVRYVFGENLFEDTTQGMIICDALALCVVTCEVVISRIATKRSFHPVVLVMCLVNVVSVPVSLALSCLYFVTLFFELSYHLKLPVFGVIRNVYVDGIFDMLHMGHLKHFERAAKLGTRLFVGVVNDEDATPYKRKPIMTSQERCDMVAWSRSVYAVIPNAPCVKGGLNEEFLKRHNIHIVACGEEYDNPEDEWYAAPRRLGMIRVLPRTAMISTSDIIQRILQREADKQKEESVKS